jgi:hypothetical protein
MARERTFVPTMPLFHYTGEPELESILRNGNMWFTDYRHLNDDREVSHGLDLAQKVIAEMLASPKPPKANLFLDVLADLLRNSNFDDTLAFFVGSMSEEPDSPYQWKRYGRDGTGVALGLAPHILAPFDPVSPLANENGCLGRVEYDLAVVASYHRRSIGRALAVFKEAMLQNPSISLGEALEFSQELAKDLIAATLIWNCLTSKSPDWQIEREVRLVTLGTRQAFDGLIRTRNRNGEVVPYVEHPLRINADRAIASIRIGPAAAAGARNRLQEMLRRVGISYDVPILDSSVRTWPPTA